MVDEFRAHGLRIFGPTKAAAQLESSKAFSKAFMQRHGIPTAEYETFTDPAAAHAYVDEKGRAHRRQGRRPGRRQGRGGGHDAGMRRMKPSTSCCVDNTLGVTHNEGGARVVIEEFLQGEEASFIVMCDGKNVAALATSQDHKRLLDGDQGPNTGGMGAYSPAPVVTPDVHGRAMREIILPTIKGMEKDGIPFTGFLYAGLMIDSRASPRRSNSTAAWATPKPSRIMMRLKSDLFDVLGGDGRHRTARSTRSSWSGTAARRWAWCWPHTAIR
jgi:phosphoribosylamine--glycine ligase